MSDTAKVLIRYGKEQDKDFIFSTWLKGQYWGNRHFNQIPQDLFFEHYGKTVSNLVYSPATTIEVAVLDEDPDTIIGYMVYTAQTIHWCYVRKAFRGKGIAKLMVSQSKTPFCAVSSLTSSGAAITKKQGWAFNPFL